MANTGFKGYNTLEEYDALTGQATGNTKPNVEGDPDYIAPFYDESSCPLPDTENPRITNFMVTSIETDSISLSWDASDNVGVTSQVLHYKPYNQPWVQINLTGSARSYTIFGLDEDTIHDMYLVPKDAAGNEGISQLLRATTETTNLPLIYLAGGNDGSGFSTSSLACGETIITKQLYWEKLSSEPYPNGLDRVYTDKGGVNSFNGAGNWWAYNGDRVIQIDAAGVILNSYDCTQTLTVSPTSYDTTSSSTSFTLTVTSNSTWDVLESSSWITTSVSSGTGNGSVTVNISGNTGDTRNDIITVRLTDGAISRQIPISQESDSVVYPHSVSLDSFSSSNACNFQRNLTKYTDTQGFAAANKLYSDSSGTLETSTGYFSDHQGWIYWNAKDEVVTSRGFCGGI